MEQSLSVAGAIVLCLGCICGSAAKADESRSAQPSTRPAPATQEANNDPDFLKGREAARKDLAAGIVGEKLPIPEAFMLEWTAAGSEDANLLAYYQAVVADKYGIRSQDVVFIPGNNDRLNWVRGYNEEMRPATERRCGKQALKKAWVEACDMSTEKRKAYLEARASRQNSKTDPSTRPTLQP